ncbi:potassium channel family protein [Natrinema salsiterrestre]|uniref:Potassium channel family protein n=1 Tax=Natrinema salsiterrestre TaxID=2950540 RepID=A0A9Q4L1B6_9EURY|nr:potassium channel family protein [Natrinema salsiterrestre]MDF9745504.1 potassium channel family protein [Natrinema salsiterrestre]
MNPVPFGLGVLLLVAVVVDLLWTTLWVEGGAGPLTSQLMAVTWSGFRRVGDRGSRLLTLSGPVTLLIGLVTWIVLLWGGWTLVFAGAEYPLIDTIGGGPISWSDRVYYTGYTIFTLGNGDLVPRDGPWQIATTIATASGMLFVTLSVTYVLSVLDAVTQKRSFASSVSGLGSRSDEILRTSWNGDEFDGLELSLNALTSQLNTLTANHKAYPILHYFHTTQSDRAPVMSVALLDDTLTLLRFGVPERNRPSDTIVKNARASVDSYLGTLHEAFIQPADRSPPAPDIEPLRDADIPTVADAEFEASVADLQDRRRLLLALVESDVRQWPSTETT